MAARDDIIDFAETLLDSRSFTDFGPNGLQVAGSSDVSMVASAVSCTLDVFERAAAAGAQLLLVHHGLFWRDTPQVIDGSARDRLAVLFQHDINLAAFHLPLDAHAELGNNAILCDRLGLEPQPTPFVVHGGRAIGLIARSSESRSLDTLIEQVTAVVQREPLVLGAAPADIRTVAICSGGSASSVAEAIRLGADAFVTGEPNEPAHATATEGGIAFLAAGHHATEVFGVQALGARLADEFGLDHVFLDVDNPV